MKIRSVLIILVAGLCIAFVTEFWLSIEELKRNAELCSNSRASCDYESQHPVALLHLLSFVLLGTVVFAQKYYWSMVIAVGYFALDIFGTYSRLSFYGEICPEGHPCWAAIRRATWFDWSAITILAFSIGLIIWKVSQKRNQDLA